MDPGRTSELLSSLNIAPSKSRGQNFLIDSRVADRQVGYADIQPDDVVLEIGPGLGVLTSRLAGKAAKVVAIELDGRLAAHLRETMPPNVEIIEADALEAELPEFDRVVANLPYSISTPIIFRLLERGFARGVVMVQKEFADRMAASPGSKDYSRLTVNVYYRAECRLLEKVPRSRFRPEPQVDSAVVELVPRPPPFKVRDEKLFLSIVATLFQHRRKKISSGLRAAGFGADVAKSAPFADLRAEVLTPEQLGQLSDAVAALSGRP